MFNETQCQAPLQNDRVNRLVQPLEGSKTKTGLVYGDASKTQRPGLSYGLTVDGTQRQSLSYDAMARCTKETVTLPGGQTRENRFTYGTLHHLTDTEYQKDYIWYEDHHVSV